MTIYTGDDATAGSEVHWYVGGEVATENITVTADDVTATYIALSGKAEQGSVILRVNGVLTFAQEFSSATGTGEATDSSGVLSIKYTAITLGDVLEIGYLKITTATLAEVAMCQDVSTSFDITEIAEDVHGQVNQVKKTGTVNQTADLGKIDYTPEFAAAFFGESVKDAGGNMVYTTRFKGAKKLGALVGKREDTSGTVTKKYFLYGCQPTSVGKDFPAAGMYKESLSLTVDDYSEWEAAPA